MFTALQNERQAQQPRSPRGFRSIVGWEACTFQTAGQYRQAPNFRTTATPAGQVICPRSSVGQSAVLVRQMSRVRIYAGGSISSRGRVARHPAFNRYNVGAIPIGSIFFMPRYSVSRERPRPLCKCGCGKACKRLGAMFYSFWCQHRYEREVYIAKWKAREISGYSERSQQASEFVINYIRAKYDNRCFRCGWNEVHPTTGNVPVEIEHIDGNHTNCCEDNLTLLCPNCHSLTPTYRGLNRGNGRTKRRQVLVAVK